MIFGASRPRRPRSTARSARRSDAFERVEELPPKLVPSVRQLFSTAVSLGHTRFSLALLELEEELQRLIHSAIYGSIALVCVFMALVVGTFTIVAAVSPDYRVMTMVIITLVYLGIAVGLGLYVKGLFTNRPPILSSTLAELEKDKETLSQMIRAHEAAEAAREQEAKQAQQEEASSKSARATRQGAI